MLIVLEPSAKCLADWPTGRGNWSATGAISDQLPDQLQLLWEARVDGLGFEAGAVIADRRVFCADADGRILAFDLDNGKELWRVELDTVFVASPLVDAGMLFLGDYQGVVRALDAKNGQLKWEVELGMEIDASPTPLDDKLLVTSQDGALYCLRRADGSQVWKYETGDQLRCGATIVGNQTFLGGCDSRLHCVDLSNGSPIGMPIPIDAPTGSTPAASLGHIFLPTHGGDIFAIDAQYQKVKWKFHDDSLAQEFENSVAVADGLIVAASRMRHVFALDQDSGQVRWQTTLRKRADASPVVSGDKVLVCGADGRLIMLDLHSGKEIWIFEVRGGFIASPAVSDGRVIALSDKGGIFCFGTR
ncbi:MAG: PQQ-binding-like beta-propeller repeat protein [Planctomycetales bacterium]|nr:PQQ-binding-like beta-propeller repeat protein [Planctomycetales bacterium]